MKTGDDKMNELMGDLSSIAAIWDERKSEAVKKALFVIINEITHRISETEREASDLQGMAQTRLYSIPTEGHFIAVWEHEDTLWSSTHKCEDDRYYEYKDGDDKWEFMPHLTPHLKALNAVYYR